MSLTEHIILNNHRVDYKTQNVFSTSMARVRFPSVTTSYGLRLLLVPGFVLRGFSPDP